MVVPAARMARVFLIAAIVGRASMPGRPSRQQQLPGALVQFSVTVLDKKNHHPVEWARSIQFRRL